MNTLLLFITRTIFLLIPDIRGFKCKRFLLRLSGARIGKNVRICSSVHIIGNGNLTIGDNTWIGDENLIVCSADIIIEQNVNIAPRCYIGTGTHEIDPEGVSIAGCGKSLPITIGNGAWICANSTIIAGSVIGEKAIVAVGSIVKGEVKKYEIVGGGLAKHIRFI